VIVDFDPTPLAAVALAAGLDFDAAWRLATGLPAEIMAAAPRDRARYVYDQAVAVAWNVTRT
jgi:hypothetical protein